MSVRLLPKSEIANLKAKDRAIQIREGVKLATKIDGLRELSARTEQELEKYRNSTLTALGEEIKALITEKERVSGEIRAMQSQYDAMIAEISLKRNEMADFENKLLSWDKRLEKREEKIVLTEIEIAEALDTAESTRIMNEDNERISRNVLIEAQNNRIESKSTLERAKHIEEKTYEDKLEIESSLHVRESVIQTKEKELSRKETYLMNKEKELDVNKIKVEDTRQTLERSLERIRQGRMA